MPRFGRILAQRIALILILLTPGTLTTLAQQAAAQASSQRASAELIAQPAATLGPPPAPSAQYASLPTPSGAYAPNCPITRRDRLRHTTSYGYDAANRLISLTDALSGTVSFGYDAAGQQTSFTNPNGQTTSTTYDALGNMLTTTDPLSRVTTYSYDLLGQLAGTTEPNGTAVGYSYDPVGNLTSITSPGSSIGYSYDALNRQTSMTDATGTTNWTYDADSQTTQVTNPQGTIGYGYDAAGEQTSLTLPGNRTVSYGYDASGQRTSLTDWQSHQTSFGYDAAGQQTSITRPNGVSTDTTYDASGQISGITHHTTSRTLASFSYAYDDAGNRISVLTAAGTESYTFDLINRLTEVDYPNGDIVSYTYDANGNRLTQTVNGVTQTATYDHADELTSLDGISYTYDANGNLLGRGSDSFAWTDQNQLSSATVNGTTANYTYDGNGNRVAASTGGNTSSYLWDDTSGLPSLVDDGTNAYLYADGLSEAVDSGNTATYPLSDALGSVRGITDASGVLASSTDYDAFGSIRAHTGASVSLGYTGALTDPTTGLLDLRARDLDPSLGRFLSRDSVSPNAPGSQGFNPYAYVANNPTSWVDPSGRAISPEEAMETLAVGGELLALLALSPELVAVAGLVALGVTIAIIFAGLAAIITCALDPECRGRAFHDAQTIGAYGSAAAAGAWTLAGLATRYAWLSYPLLPPGAQCLLGAAEGVASNTVTSAASGQHGTLLDMTFAAAAGCATGGSSGGSNAGPKHSDSVRFDAKQLQEKFDQHGSQFGASSPQSFKQALIDFIDAPTTQEIHGTWRGTTSVTHYFDPETRLYVVFGDNGEFITAFKLSSSQEQYLFTTGNVQ